MMETPLTANIRPDGRLDRAGYEATGGYGALRKVLADMAPGEVTQMVKDSGLRGRGGAGFSTGMKWGFIPLDDERPTCIVANADEMEPGTFKDRILLEGDPHQMVEAMAVSGYAIQARYAFIFLREEYRPAARALERAIGEAYEAGYLGEDILGSGYHLDLQLHTSAGRYICGEETALLSALEGHRPLPRAKPPFPQQSGLWGRPTVVNNVETLCNVPHIVNHGAAWFQGLSRTEDAGTKLYGASGKVNRPGAWELPMGTTAREVVEEHAGGMRAGHRLRGMLPGGASTPFLTDEHLDLPLDFGHVAEAGSRLGTGAIVALDERTCPVGMLANLERFFARESCGWCTPCRDGLPWTERILRAIDRGEGREGDLDNLALHCRHLGPGRTFCAHAPGAVGPLESGLKHFREDFERHIRERRCPWE
ncbi:NADH dehydrogenase subunit F [Thiohalorhabdus denitrificans]|uniref:NADH-quinone oxidoreductase subunit F n=2 Tax=Thiohalorhabdus denitrificans TaxID=381306 RepID=A0A1G5HFX1_9GAMM|nr:NADH dehydrogenase subunit F [Thiohalorhabdus denitrificans]